MHNFFSNKLIVRHHISDILVKPCQ